MLRVLFLAHLGRRERDDTDGADARERFVVGRRAESSATYYAFIFAVSAMAKPFCAWASDRGRGCRRRGAHACVGCCVSAVSALGMMTFGTRGGRSRGEVWEVSVRRTRTRLWMDTSRNGAGVFDAWEGESEGGGWTGVGDGGESGGDAAAAASAAATAVASARRAVGLSAVWTCAAAVVAWMFVLENEEGESGGCERRGRGGGRKRGTRGGARRRREKRWRRWRTSSTSSARRACSRIDSRRRRWTRSPCTRIQRSRTSCPRGDTV